MKLNNVLLACVVLGIVIVAVNTAAYVSAQRITVTATLNSCTQLGVLTARDSKNKTYDLTGSEITRYNTSNNLTLIYHENPKCLTSQITVDVGTVLNSHSFKMVKTDGGIWRLNLSLNDGSYELTFSGHIANCTYPTPCWSSF